MKTEDHKTKGISMKYIVRKIHWSTSSIYVLNTSIYRISRYIFYLLNVRDTFVRKYVIKYFAKVDIMSLNY